MKPLIKITLFLLIVSQVWSCRTPYVQLPFCLTLNAYVPDIKNHIYDTATKTLRISWDTVLCARQYQLEWTFAGQEDAAILDPGWTPDFRFNSTRIVTSATHYNIPIVFEEGTLIFRIRCVMINDQLNQARFSSWSAVFNAGANAGFANLRASTNFPVSSSLAHESNKLNWQYTTSYMEDGLRKDEIQYLDGTFRQRQAVKFFNTDTIALASNTIYDNEGRPAISTILSPVLLNQNDQYGHYIGYYALQALAGADTVYNYRHFDLDQFSVQSDSCSPLVLRPRSMWNQFGVSKYFSANNHDKSGFQGFVPDGGQFPFVQTQWADDNTQRVIRTSEPGKLHYIGSNHETQFRYADVAQDEIDMLFGNDAGNEKFYKKTIRQDPNGQQSVEYARIDGKVVATALAGPVPANLEAIPTQVVPVNVDIVGTEQTVSVEGIAKFSTKTFDLSNNATCYFGYRLLPRSFEKELCNNEKICLDCRYRIQLMVKDQNGNIIHQVDTAIGTLLQNCAGGNEPAYRNLFTKVLCKGNYTVSRSLTIDTSAFENYYLAYLKKADSCSDESVRFPVPEKISTVCTLTCAECQAIPDSLKGSLKEYCEMICNAGFASPCDHAKAMMAMNLSPGGQYAQYDKVLGNVDATKYPLSIYHNGKWRTLTTPAPADLAQYISANDLNGLVNNWKTSWADYFLPLHPEYCYYRYCQANEKQYVESKHFNDSMQAVRNARQAITSKFIDPLGNDPSLQSFGIYNQVKAKLDNFRAGKDLKEFIYSGFQNCRSVPPYNNNFANTPDTFANNMQWQMFRALYIATKSQVIDSLREVFVKSCGGFCNKCIGDSLNHYTSCNPPGCTIPGDTICNQLKKKVKLFPSTYSFDEILPFRLTGIDKLDLEIIQNYTSRKFATNCRCEKHGQMEHIFRYVIAKNRLTSNIFIPDTLCSVGINYEMIPGYRGDLNWRASVQAGNLEATLFDTTRRRICSLNFITTDSVIPWQKIVLISCLRPNRLPVKFAAGPDIFLVDLYDSTYKKYTAEAKISCLDTGSCKPVKTCRFNCDPNGLQEIFNCGFRSGGHSASIIIKDSLIKNWFECTYRTKISEGKLLWRTTVRGSQLLVSIGINAVKADKKNFIDSCQYEFDFGADIVYAGSAMQVISVEPDRGDSKDSCKIFGIKMIVKIQVEDWPPRYIIVYGKPSKNCFPIADCCHPEPPKKCPNELNPTKTDTVNVRPGIDGIIWRKRFELKHPDYYHFSFTANITGDREAITVDMLTKLMEISIDGEVHTKDLKIRETGKNQFFIENRLPIPHKRFHYLQVGIKPGDLRRLNVKANNFSLVAANCDDCCLPVFPPLPPYNPAECDSTQVIVDGHNGEIVRSQYLAELRKKLKLDYIGHCMSNIDSFNLRYSDQLYHFTLYYYDQANNLVTTVPPKGVRLLPADSVRRVQLHRQNPSNPAIYPNHRFRNDYQFNSLNNVTVTTTPDAGSSRNWYDPMGRLVIQQHARQTLQQKYNYALYDNLNRIVQSGEFVKAGADIPSLVQDSLALVNTLRASERHDVKSVIFDQPLVDSINGLSSVYRKKPGFTGDTLNYARLKVAATLLTDTIPAGTAILPATYKHAVHYWYDMHGNIRLLVHEIPELFVLNQHLKSIAYDYELINGDVKKIRYQQDEKDRFFTRYTYDADNRLAQVATSIDDTTWERDARYYYYKHGPLARMEIGEADIQGLDYLYTIQGRLKSINSAHPEERQDPGMDGVVPRPHQQFARDVFGFEIGYHRNDYDAISGAGNYRDRIYDSLHIQNGLYDGNIRHTITRLNVPLLSNKIQASVYSYDQLNRLTTSAFNSVQPNLAATSLLPDYGMRLSYDANGNIQTLFRNGTTAAAGKLPMDALTYHYNGINNQLQYITDTVNAGNYNNDIDGNLPGNYAYDANGNMVKDRGENIDTVLWNANGRIARIVKDGGTTRIDFSYNAMGQRLSKSANGKTTWYISDLDGRVLATYHHDTAGLNADSYTIWGPKRLGVYNRDSSRNYELTDHLGNVLATISNRKIGIDADSNGITDYYAADVISAVDYYPFGMQMPGRVYNANTYRYGYGGHEKDDEVAGEGNHLSFGDYGYQTRDGRRWSVDPEFEKFEDISPYAYALNNPLYYVDEDGRIAFVPLAIKAGAEGGVDMLIQLAMAYYFDPEVENVEQAIDKIDWKQVGWAALQGALPWKPPGGRFGKAAMSAAGDVMINLFNKGKNYTIEEALQDFAVGFVSDLAGGGISELLAKYGSRALGKGLSKMGFDDKMIERFLTGKGTTWKGRADYTIVDLNDKNFSKRKAGKDFTKKQKREILWENWKHNNGYLRSDLDGEFLDYPVKDLPNVPTNMKSAQIDHVLARKHPVTPGPNTGGNAQVLSKAQNMAKSNN